MVVARVPAVSLFGKLIPWWVQPLIIALLLAFILGQRVQVSNAKARAARSEQALAEYKLSVSETTRILQADNDRKRFDQLARAKEAADAARTREKSLLADAAGARSELDRLRLAISRATRRDPVPSTTAPAETQPADPVAELLGTCAAEVQELAGAADAHASDVQTLIESWPR